MRECYVLSFPCYNTGESKFLDTIIYLLNLKSRPNITGSMDN